MTRQIGVGIKTQVSVLSCLLMLMTCRVTPPNHVQLVFPDRIRVSGAFEQRIELTERRLMADHPFKIDFVVQDVARKPGLERRFEEYEGDISGRILSAWSYIARLLNQRPSNLDSIAENVLCFQNNDGSFGKNQQLEGWDMWGRQLWGHGRLLVGLVEYFKLTHDQRFLESAENLGDYIVAGMGKWQLENRGHHWFTNYTSLLESLMMLNGISGKPRYLEAAQKIVPMIPEFGYYHSHGYLISLVGLAKLHQVVNNGKYWQQLCDTYWRQLIRYAKRPDGGICEWFPTVDRTEGCSIVDWLRLNLAMWEISKDAIYLEEAENTWLNALNFHQTQNGAFGHARLSSRGYDAPYSESWWCCLMHGLFGYSEILKHMVVADNNNLWLNFLTPLQVQVAVGGSAISLRVETDYPSDGHVDIRFESAQETDFCLKVRIPKWVDNVAVDLNGSHINQSPEAGYLRLQRQWKSGDLLSIYFPIPMRLEDAKGNTVNANSTVDHRQHAGHFFYGPLLLTVDLNQNAGFPDLLLFDSSTDYRYPDKDFCNQYSYPNTHFKLPAMRNRQAVDVFLTPLSDQTGYFEWSDIMPNFIRTGEKPILRSAVQMEFEVQILR